MLTEYVHCMSITTLARSLGQDFAFSVIYLVFIQQKRPTINKKCTFLPEWNASTKAAPVLCKDVNNINFQKSSNTWGASDLHFGIILFLSLCLPSPMCGLRNLLWTFQKWTALLQAKIHLLKCAKCTRSYMTVQSTYINQQCFPHHFICSIKKKKIGH